MASDKQSLVLAAAALLLLCALRPVLALDPRPPHLESVRWDTGERTSGVCVGQPKFSPNSRFLAFSCYGDDLTPGDINDRLDVVVRDRATGATELVSISSENQQVPFDSSGGQPSSNGRKVAFGSRGPLHPDYNPPVTGIDPFGPIAIFLRDGAAGVTDMLSRDASGIALTHGVLFYGVNHDRHEVLLGYSGDIRVGPAPGPFGSPVQLWVKNWETGDVELISATPDGSMTQGSGFLGSLSSDARYVVFVAGAGLGPPSRPEDRNLYIRDRFAGTTERLTFPRNGGEFQGEPVQVYAPGVSADGRYVVFASNHPDLRPGPDVLGTLHVYLIDRNTGELTHLSATPGYPSLNDFPNISDDGRYVSWFTRTFSFDGPPNPTADMRAIWVLDRHTGQRVNVTAPLGPLLNDSPIWSQLSPDGSAIAFLWRVADPSSPLFGGPLVYTVQLLGEPPTVPPPAVTPVPIPTNSRWPLLALAAGLLLLGLRRRFARSL